MSSVLGKNNIILALVTLTLISSIALGFNLFYYVAQHDLVWLEFYNIGEIFVNQSLMDQSFLTSMEGTFVAGANIPKVLDWFWLGTFLALVGEMLYISYKSGRDDLFGVLNFINYGIMVALFIASYYFTVSEWIYDIFINKLLMGIAFQVPFFTYYMSNFGTINLLIIGACLVLNFVDFDVAKFGSQKRKEFTALENDEL